MQLYISKPAVTLFGCVIYPFFPSKLLSMRSNYLLLQSAGRESGDLVVEQLLGSGPDGRVVEVVEGQERGKEVICMISTVSFRFLVDSGQAWGRGGQ